MANHPPTLYSTKKTMMWFGVSSLVLLISLVGLVTTDYLREWKTYQRQFVQLKRDKAKSELQAAQKKINAKQLETLEKKKREAQDAFEKHAREYNLVQKEIRTLETQATIKRTQFQDLKQFKDSYKYYFEELQHTHDKRARHYEKKLTQIEPTLNQLQRELDALEIQKEEKVKQSESFLTEQANIKKQIDDILKDSQRIERSFKKITPNLANDILNLPMLDFIAPTLRIQQVVLEDLYDDYHFSKVQKVDRCTTCHLGIDQKGFENAPQPFKTHPKLDLYLSPSSPHALEKVGCTVCHGGNGHSVSFIDSAHMPHSEEEKKEWEKKYHWRQLDKWEPLMTPLQNIEANCVKCHRNTTFVPEAVKLNEGRRLAMTYGCFGCHKVQGFENAWKVGPSLQNVQSKLTREWIIKWLQNPQSFRHSTKMPRIFHLQNMTTPDENDKDDTVIHATTQYLLKNSGTVALKNLPVTGRAEEGKKRIEELGCLGCHSHGENTAARFAAELSSLGSKLTSQWLYTWLKDPKHYSAATRMPNLRLSDQEAADITSYLLSERNQAFENQSVPPVKDELVNELALHHLQKTLRRSEAEAQLNKMNQESRLEYLGKQTILHQGCFACHDIKGFEETKPIGTELSDHSRKNIHQLDFGLIHLEHTRQAWFFQKLKEPRLFDQGKIKDYYEKLRMPQFGFTDEQASALVTFLLSLTKEDIPLSMQKRLSHRESQIETGRFMVAQFNCQGCHTLDGRSGDIRKLYEDQGYAPPILDGEGKKVQEKWLHEFIRSPETIRAWLKVRMPTFGFTDEQIMTLVHYFDALDHQEVSYQGYHPLATTPDKLASGEKLFQLFQCIKCHKVDAQSAQLGASFLAPDLGLTKERLKPEWVVEWLADPQRLMEGTMMPGFFPDGNTPAPDILHGEAKVQMEAIRDYLYRYAPHNSDKVKSS